MGYEQKINHTLAIAQTGDQVKEARGRTIGVGDELLILTPHPHYFEVTAIGPVLDPRLPSGLLQVRMACVVTFLAQPGKLNQEFIRVRTAEEANRSPRPEDQPEPPPSSGGLS